MKKLLFATILSILSVTGFATDKFENNDDAKKVSYAAKKQFEQEFNQAKDIKWTVSNDYQRAQFTLDGKNLSAVYDTYGNFLVATKLISFDEVPASAKKEIAKHYQDYTFSEAIEIVNRAANDTQTDDTGTIWINLTKNGKQVILSYTDFTGVSLFKTFNTVQTAKN